METIQPSSRGEKKMENKNELNLPWSPSPKKLQKGLEVEGNFEEVKTNLFNHSNSPNHSTQGTYPKFQFHLDLEEDNDHHLTDNPKGLKNSQLLQFNEGSTPWSPTKGLEKNTIAYIFGKLDNDVAELLQFLLKEQHEIELVTDVAGQPIPPFPLFYIHDKSLEYDINEVIKVGKETSNDHFFVIKHTDVGLDVPKDIPVLNIDSDCQYNTDTLTLLAEEMADKIKKVYNTNSLSL